jgi:ABC-type spermidine/putrescine transport system permease subunit II
MSTETPVASAAAGRTTGQAARTPLRRRRRLDGPAVSMRVWAVLVFIFLYLPILFVVFYSFNSGRVLLTWRGFGTNWYTTAINNTQIQHAVFISVIVGVVSALVSIVLGSLAGIAVARRAGRWTRPFLLIVFLVLVTPEIVDGISYLIWFVRLNLGSGLTRLVIGHSVFSSAVVTLIVQARLSGLDESLEEAAADLGATPARAFRDITVPLIMPAVLAGGLLSFTFSLDDVIVSTFVSTAGTSTLPVYIFSALRLGLKGDIAAISTVALLVTLAVLGLTALVLRRGGDTAEDVAATLTGG